MAAADDAADPDVGDRSTGERHDATILPVRSSESMHSIVIDRRTADRRVAAAAMLAIAIGTGLDAVVFATAYGILLRA